MCRSGAETRKTAGRDLGTLRRRTMRWEPLVPEAIDTPGSERRHRVYKITGLKALPGADGALELSGDVFWFPKNGISSS